MKILIIGEEANVDECETKFGSGHQYSVFSGHWEAANYVENHDIIFDFLIDESPDKLEIYSGLTGNIFLNTAKVSLHELLNLQIKSFNCCFFGFIGLPTLLNREIMEVSVFEESSKENLSLIMTELKSDYVIVDDRVGMVTPRIISMIINEAYYTVQEGTATKADIDTAMRLGTNYPFGPFEWCDRIGLRHVYELLEAVYNDTADERYKICPLLKKAYLKIGRL